MFNAASNDSLDDNPNPYLVETFVSNNGDVFLLGNDANLLQNKIRTIASYAAKSYPPIKTGRTQTCFFRPKENAPSTQAMHILNKKYRYCLPLNAILPPFIKSIIELSHHSDYGTPRSKLHPMNCYGAACAAAGIIPLASTLNELLIDAGMTDEISYQYLSTGDIVELDNKHALVYLDDDICLSANGRSAPLEIYPTNAVLKTYGTDLQQLKEPDSRIRFFRKNPRVRYSDDLITSIINYYTHSLTTDETLEAIHRECCLNTTNSYSIYLKELYQTLHERRLEQSSIIPCRLL